MQQIGIGIPKKKAFNSNGAGLSIIDGSLHWYKANSNLTLVGSSPIKATRIPDLIGTIDLLDTSIGDGWIYNSLDPDIANKPSVTNSTGTMKTVDRSIGDSAVGWNISLPISITILARLGYTSGNPSSMFGDTRGYGLCIQIFRKSPTPLTSADANQFRAASSNNLQLNGAGDLNINWNSNTNNNLAPSEFTPYQFLTFEFNITEQKFYRNGVLKVTSGVPVSPRNFDGSQITLAANLTNGLILSEIFVTNSNLDSDEMDFLKSYFNNEYGTAF